jgi:hypothetical protein
VSALARCACQDVAVTDDDAREHFLKLFVNPRIVHADCTTGFTTAGAPGIWCRHTCRVATGPVWCRAAG